MLKVPPALPAVAASATSEGECGCRSAGGPARGSRERSERLAKVGNHHPPTSYGWQAGSLAFRPDLLLRRATARQATFAHECRRSTYPVRALVSTPPWRDFRSGPLAIRVPILQPIHGRGHRTVAVLMRSTPRGTLSSPFVGAQRQPTVSLRFRRRTLLLHHPPRTDQAQRRRRIRARGLSRPTQLRR